MEHPEIAMKMTGEMSRHSKPDCNFKRNSIFVNYDRVEAAEIVREWFKVNRIKDML